MLGFLDRGLSLEARCTTIIVYPPLPFHNGQALRMTGADRPDVLHFAYLWDTLTLTEVAGTERRVTSLQTTTPTRPKQHR